MDHQSFLPILIPKPYAFADFLAMKPGTMLGGFMSIGDSWHLGPSWIIPPSFRTSNSSSKTVYSAYVLTEYAVRWRLNLRQSSRKISKSRLYMPQLTSLDRVWRNMQNTMRIEFNCHAPVGIYLGHVLRCNSVYLVNILTPDGYDCWL